MTEQKFKLDRIREYDPYQPRAFRDQKRAKLLKREQARIARKVAKLQRLLTGRVR